MKSLWHINPLSSEIRDEVPPESKSADAIEIQSLYSSISYGTELLVATGQIPLQLHTVMSVPYMAGDFTFPIKYGYSCVGKTSNGDLVHLMHPHQSHFSAHPESLYYFSKAIDPLVATQFSNLETVLNAIWISGVKAGDRVLVCGAGSIGVLLAQTLKHYIQAEVSILEVNSLKKKRLQELGFRLCYGNQEYDICFNTSASEIGLQYGIDHCTTEGAIIELSWYGTRKIELNLGSKFHYKRLKIISSQVSEIPYCKPEHTFLTRKQEVEHLLQTVDYKCFLDMIIPFEHMPQFFDEARQGKTNSNFITIVTY